MDSDAKRRVTAADVAKRAGVSRSAVSRAFTDGAYLAPAKRALIEAAAQELGYRPNAMAAGLQGRRSNLIAIFVGEMANEYDKEVAAKLISGLNEAGKWPIVIGGSGDAARDAVNNVLRYPLEAMILRSGSLSTDISEACGKLGIPVIASGRVLDAAGVDNVCCRNHEGMAKGTELLIQRGRTRFGYIGGPAGFGASAERKSGVIETLDMSGFALHADATGAFTVQSGYDAVMSMKNCAALDALICANDAMAIGALGALRERGRTVPEDISVIGFDDISMAKWPSIQLTTLRNPINGLVSSILDLLDRRQSNPDKASEMIWLDAEVILRATH